MAAKDRTDKALALYKGEALAPMVRASTTPLRTLAIRYGADLVYTEEIVDRAIIETKRVENVEKGSNGDSDSLGIKTIDYVKDTSKMSQRVQRRMERDGLPPLLLRIDRAVEQNKLVFQLGTGDAELALQAALHVHRDVDAIDVNMGCPKPFSVSGGMGSSLLSDPDRACRIITKLSSNLPDNKPVSAKIRLLQDTAKTVDFLTGLINAGANAVAIHGRRVGDESQTPADWETLEQVVALTKSKFPSVPVLVNGDFYTRQEFVDFQEKSGADGVLLARPALFNTSIFRKPPVNDAASVKYSYDSCLLLDKTTVVQDYLREVTKYNIHHKNAKYVICEMMSNRRAPLSRVPFLKQYYPGQQTIGLMSSCSSVADICQLWKLDNNNSINSRILNAPAAAATTNKNSFSAPAPVLLANDKEPVVVPTAGEHRYDDCYLLKMAEEPTTDGTTAAAAAPSTAVMADAPAATCSSQDTNVLDSPPPNKKIRVDSDT